MGRIFFRIVGLILIILFFYFGRVIFNNNATNVLAEDDLESTDQNQSSTIINTQTTKETPQPNIEVTKTVQTVVLNDSDGDGILDKDDPHPNVAEIYIVKDENSNGIVDYFE